MASAPIRKLVKRHAWLRALLSPAIAARDKMRTRTRRKVSELLRKSGSLFAEDPVLRIPDFLGDFQIGPCSDNFIRLVSEGCYEPELARLCARLVDSSRDAIDVGANVGFFSVLFAKSCPSRTILAIEPTPSCLRRLERNLKRNGVEDQVRVIPGVVSDLSGTVSLKVVDGREEYSSLGGMHHPAIEGIGWVELETEAVTLDELVSSTNLRPGFLKVDVEGAEHLVFRGAPATLAKHRPVILSELSDALLRSNGSSAREVMGMVSAAGYDIYDPVDPCRPAGVRPFGDMICFPKESAVTADRLMAMIEA